MAEQIFKLPDIGEGIVEAELADWMVKVGDLVREDDIICEVTTDKATVEIPAPFSGRVIWLAGEPGAVLAIGSALIRIEVAEAGQPPAPMPEAEPEPAPDPETRAEEPPAAKPPAASPRPERTEPAAPRFATNASGRPLAAPSVRRRAREAGVDLRYLRGTGPAGRITHEDLDTWLEGGDAIRPAHGFARRDGSEDIRVTGIRRTIAERMALAKSRIPHFSIIEEVEIEAMENLRQDLNARHGETRGKLTPLPLLVCALCEALRDHPGINATYDDEAGIITRHNPVHCGIATQTDAGLMVPVLRHAEAMTPWQAAADIRRLSEGARSRRTGPGELAGSTITITSLGPLGAVATTPIINHPEVAIIGINRMAVRPVWDGRAFQPRRVMNLSCSFDHRVVDGWDAAEFVATMKRLIEMPALIFMERHDG